MPIHNGSIRRKDSGNQWFKNVAKSLGYTSTELITDLAPSTVDMVKSNGTFLSDSIAELRQLRSGGGSRILDALNIKEQADIAKEALRNARDDLKSGNINNQSRRNKAIEDSFGMGDFGDDDFGLVDIDIDDSDDVGTVVKDKAGEPAVIVPRVNVNVIPPAMTANNPMLKSMTRQTSTIANTAKAQMQQTEKIASAQFGVNFRFQTNMTDAIGAVNNNLSLLVQFQNDSMSKYIGASLKYYEESLQSMQTSMKHLQMMMPEKDPRKGPKENPMDNVISGGGFNLQGYVGEVRKNVKNQFEVNPILSAVKMMFDDKNTLRDLAQSPLSFISTKIVTTVLPKFFQESMRALDRSIENFFPAVMAKMSSWRESDSPLMRMMGELFGVRNIKKTRPDLGRYERGQIPFDGETKVAITEVIPGYLRKILAELSGGEDMAFDYKQRRFRKATEMKADYDREVQRKSVNAYSESQERILRNSNAFQFKDDRERERFNKGVTEFLEAMTKKGSFVNPELRRGKNGEVIDDLKDTYTFNDAALDKLLRQSIMSMSKGQRVKMFGNEFLGATQELRQMMEQLEVNPTDMNAQVIFDGLGLGKDTKNKKDKPKIGRSGINADQYGKTSTDYLRDIKSVLLQGIKVLPMGGFGSQRMDRNARGEYNETMAKHKLSLQSMESEEKKVKDAAKERPARQKTYSEKELTRMFRQGQVSADSIDLLDISDRDMQDQIQSYLRNLEGKDTAEKKGFLHGAVKYLKGDKQERANMLSTTIDNLMKKPAKMFQSVLNRVDDTMYSIVFGKGGDPNKASFFNRVLTGIDTNFQRIGDWMQTSLFDPMKNFFVGENGVVNKVKNSDKYKEFKGYVKKGNDVLFGAKDINGVRRDGLLGDYGNELMDHKAAFRHIITGKAYTDRNGQKFDKNPDSVFGEIGKVFKSFRGNIKEYLVGDKNAKDTDNQKGILTGVGTAIGDGFNTFREAIFGPKEMKGGKFESRSFKEMMKIMRQRAPKAMAWGTLGTGALALAGGTGLLGSLILPGGPLGAALLGSAIGFATQSEGFNSFMFGEKGFDGKRMGGIISTGVQDFFKKNKAAMLGGATVGVLKPMLGLGLIPSFLLPGGPIGGALFGVGTAMLYRSEAVQKVLFGEKDFDGVRAGGLLQKAFGKKVKGKSVLGNIAVGTAGGAGLAAAIGQFGLIGAMLTPGGMIGGALLGAAAGIALSSDRWKKSLFGEWNIETGTREGGLLGRTINRYKVNVEEPLKQAAKEMSFGVRKWFTKKVSNPLEDAIAPLKQMFRNTAKDVHAFVFNGYKNIKRTVGGVGSLIGSTVNKFLENDAINPMVTYVRHYITGPLSRSLGRVTSAIVDGMLAIPGKLTRGIMTGISKVIGGIVTMPIKALSAFTNGALDISHRTRGVKAMRKSERAALREQKDAGYNIGWRKTTDQDGNEVGDGRWGSWKRRYFDGEYIRQAQYNKEGAAYQLTENVRKKDRDEKQDVAFAEREAELKESKARVKALKKFGRRHQYENISEDGVDISRFYKTTKSKRRFGAVMGNADSRNVLERTIESQLGINASDIFGADYDPEKITKRQRQLLQSAVKKKVKGVNFDIRKHFGLGEKEEPTVTTGLDSMASEVSKVGSEVNTMSTHVVEAIRSTSAREDIQKLLPATDRQTTFLETISTNTGKLLSFMGNGKLDAPIPLPPKSSPTAGSQPISVASHEEPVAKPQARVNRQIHVGQTTGYSQTAVEQLTDIIRSVLHGNNPIKVIMDGMTPPSNTGGGSSTSAQHAPMEAAPQGGESGGTGTSHHAPVLPQHSNGGASSAGRAISAKGAWNRMRNFRRNGGVAGMLGRSAGFVQRGMNFIGTAGRSLSNKVHSAQTLGFVNLLKGGISSVGQNMKNTFNGQRNAVMGGRQSYLDPRHAGGSDMYQNPTEGAMAGIGNPSASAGVTSSLATSGGMFAPISSLSMNESYRQKDTMPGDLDSRLEARQAFNRRRTGDYEQEQLRIKEERAAVTSFRDSMMAHANNIDLTTYEILEILRNWPHCCQDGLKIPPVVVPPIGGGKPPKQKGQKPKAEPRPPKGPVKPQPQTVPQPKTVPVTPETVPQGHPAWDWGLDPSPQPSPSPTPQGHPSWDWDWGTAPQPTPGPAPSPSPSPSPSPGWGWGDLVNIPVPGWSGRGAVRVGKKAARAGRRVVEGGRGFLGKAWEFGKKALTSGRHGLNNMLGVGGNVLKEGLGRALDFGKSGWTTGKLGIGNLGRGIGGALKNGGKKVQDWLNQGRGGLVTAAEKIKGGASKVIGGVKNYGKTVGRNLRYVLSGGAQAEMGFINNPFSGVKVPKFVKDLIRGGDPEFNAEQKAISKDNWEARKKAVKEAAKKAKSVAKNVARETYVNGKYILRGAKDGFVTTAKGAANVFKGGFKSSLSNISNGVSNMFDIGEDLVTRGAKNIGGKAANVLNKGGAILGDKLSRFGGNVKDIFKGTGEKGGRLGGLKGATRSALGVVGRWASPVLGAFSGAESVKNVNDTFKTKKATTAQKIVAGATGFLHGASPLALAKAAFGKDSKVVGSKDDFTREIYALKNPKDWWKNYGKKSLKTMWDETSWNMDYEAPEWWQNLSKNNKTVGKVNDWVSKNVGGNWNKAAGWVGDKIKGSVPGKLVTGAKNLGVSAFNKAKEWYPGIKNGLKTAGEGFGIIGDHIGDLATKTGKGVKNFFKSPTKSISEFFFGKKVGAEEKDVFPKKDKNGKVIPGKFVDKNGKDVNPMAAKKGSLAGLFDDKEDKGFLGNAKEKAKEVWDKLTKSMTDGWKSISDTITKPLKDMKDNASKTWNSITDFVSGKWDDTKDAISKPVKKLWDGTKKKWNEVTDYVSGKWDDTKTAVSEPVKKLWNGTKKKWNEVADYVSGKWKDTKEAVTTPVKKLWNDTKKVWKAAGKYVSEKWDETKDAVTGPVKEVWTKTKKIWNGAKEYVVEKWNDAKDSLSKSVKSVWSKTKKIWTDTKEYVSDKWDSTKDFLTKKVKAVYDKTKKSWEDSRKYVADKWDDTKDYLVKKTKAVYDKTKKIWEDSRKYIADKWDDTKSYLVSKTKAVYDKTKKVWEDARKYVADKWDDTKDEVTKKVKSVYEKSKKVWEDARKYVADKWDDTKEAVVKPVKAIWTKTTSMWDSTSSYVSTKWDETKTYVTDKISAVKKMTTNLVDKLLGIFTGAKDKIVETKDKVKEKIGKTADKLYDSVFGVITSATDAVKGFGTSIAKKTQGVFEKLFGGGVLSDKERKKRYGGGGANFTTIHDQAGYGGGDAASDPTATPFFSQKDNKWGNMGYGDFKVKDIGCAPTSAAMVVNKLTGNNVTPQDMAKQAMGAGFVDPTLGTHKDFFTAVGMKETAAKSKEVMSQLAQNKPVVFRGEGGGPYTQNGHFLVATGMTKDGKVKVNDPLKNAPTTVSSSDLFNKATTSFVAPTATQNPTASRRDTAKGFGAGASSLARTRPIATRSRNQKTGWELPKERDVELMQNVHDRLAYGAGSVKSTSRAQNYGAGYRSGRGVMSDSLVSCEYRDTGNATTPKSYHTGIDLVDKKGNKSRALKAFTNGTVVSAGPAGAWGNLVVIVDEHGYKHYYAHLSRITARAGQKLKKGSMLGYQGSTGNSTGSHLHYEVVRPGTNHGQTTSDIDPEDYANKYSPDKSFIGTLIDGASAVIEGTKDLFNKVKDSAMGIFDFVMGAEDIKPLQLIGDLGVSLSQSLISKLTPGWVGDAAAKTGVDAGVDTSTYLPGKLKNTPVGKLANKRIDSYVDMSASDINAWINSRASKTSVMRGLGKDFVEAGKKYNIDPRMLVSLAAQESGWGTSNIARTKGNLFGWKAYDSSPFASSTKFSKAGGSVHYVADRLRNLYINQWHLDTLAEMNTKYSTSHDWALNIARIMQSAPKTANGGGMAPLSMALGIGGGSDKDLPTELLIPEQFGRGKGGCTSCKTSKRPNMFGGGTAPKAKAMTTIKRNLNTPSVRQETTIRTPEPTFPSLAPRSTSSATPVPEEGLMHVAIDLMQEMVTTLHVIAANTEDSSNQLASLNARREELRREAASKKPAKSSASNKPYNANPVAQAVNQPSARSQKDRSIAQRISQGR